MLHQNERDPVAVRLHELLIEAADDPARIETEHRIHETVSGVLEGESGPFRPYGGIVTAWTLWQRYVVPWEPPQRVTSLSSPSEKEINPLGPYGLVGRDLMLLDPIEKPVSVRRWVIEQQLRSMIDAR